MRCPSTLSLLALLALAGPARADKAAKPAKAAASHGDASQPAPAAAEAPKPAPRHVKVGVTEGGFEPAEIAAKPNETVVLDITRVTEETCATTVVVPSQQLKVELPMNKEVPVTIQAGKEGRVPFACPMDMVKGAVVVKP